MALPNFIEPFNFRRRLPCYCDDSIKFYLSILFNLCLRHGFIPHACIDTVLVPIVKNKNKNVQDINNYRPIALATVISKLFERFILYHNSSFMQTSSNQKFARDKLMFRL